MHRTREYLSYWLLPALLLSVWTVLDAAPVSSLYGAVVPESEPQRAATLAMREVLVRLVGSREAADDPALAGILEDARRYVQVEHTTTRGSTQVIFDATALRGAVTAAGRTVWDPDRPLVWVVLPPQEGAGSDELRAQLNSEAGLRGLPIALVSADSAGAAGVANAATPNSAALLAAAHRAGAAAALVAQPGGADPQVLQWSLVASGAEAHWTGSGAAAIDGATDALVRASRELESAPASEYDCRVAGVTDLASFTAVLDSIGAAPGVSELTIRAVESDQLTLHFRSRSAPAALTRSLAAGHLRAGTPDGDGVLQYRFQSGL
jgi:hypothetical protein